MSSFDEEQILKNRPSDYHQSVLSVMGITQWHLRSVTADEAQISDPKDTQGDGSIALTQEKQQEKKVASIGSLRDVLSTGSNDYDKSKLAEEKIPTKSVSPGLNPTFPIDPSEHQFANSVVASVAEGIQTSIDWSIADSVSLSGTELETPPIAHLMNNPVAKKQLWNLLQTLV
jgi:DNA polymerase III psi subunit